MVRAEGAWGFWRGSHPVLVSFSPLQLLADVWETEAAPGSLLRSLLQLLV